MIRQKIQQQPYSAQEEERFDKDVERFSNLDTGQQITLGASFNMELITESIVRHYPQLKSVLDVGCGAGNYSVKLSQKKSNIDVTLVDLSQPMLDRALERVNTTIQGTVKKLKEILGQLTLAQKSLTSL